jgi:Arylsulfotransferase (ASST)
MNDRIQAVAFVASAMVLAIVYGTYAERQNWFPARQIKDAEITIRDVRSNWKNDLALEPTRHLAASYQTGRAENDTGFRLLRPDARTPGYTLIAGLSKDQDTSAFSVTLYDEEGQLRYVWPVDYTRLDPEGLKPLNVMLHGMEVLEDGSIVVAFDAGNAIARLDACGDPMWVEKGGYHHSVSRDDNGGLWAWRDNILSRLDEETGKVTKTMSLENDILKASGEENGALAVRSFIAGEGQPLTYTWDPYHANDVEPLSARMAAAFPQFEAGDLLVSMRELNMVGVIDPDTGTLKWWQHGPWLKQHDPDFQPDGTITIFDNASGTGSSRIYRVDPKTHTTEVLFKGGEIPFYSWQRGKHQVLESGNILVTEAEHGRVFEVTPEGALVWEREMVWDADRNLIVTEARHVPPNFFTNGLPSCASRAEG